MSFSWRNWRFFFLRAVLVGILVGVFVLKLNVKLFFTYFNFRILKSILLIQIIVLLSLFIAGIRFLLLVGKPTLPFRHVFKAILLTYV